MSRADGQEGPDPIDVYIGARIRARRKQCPMTQEQLALALGVTFQQVQKYERGSNRVSASMLVRAAVALRCRIADLFGQYAGEEREAVEDTDLVTLAGLPGGRELAVTFAQLRPDQRRAVLNVAEVIASTAGPADDVAGDDDIVITAADRAAAA